MDYHANNSVRDVGSMCLRLRGDLSFTPQTSGDETYYMIEDPLNSRFFRIGLAEYTFISLLDGTTSLHEAFSRLSTVMPNHHLSELDAASLCRWLVELDMAHTAESSQPAALAANSEKTEQRRSAGKWNPLTIRLPIARPDRCLGFLLPWVGWLFSPAAIVGWLAVVGVGAYRVLSDWDGFAGSSQGIFAPSNWLWLAACWVGLKLVHETSHGIVCKLYGGTVRELGVLFILFAPLAYVDVTSSWRFRSRMQRIHVSAAGMYIELLLAAVAAIVWSNTHSGWLNNLCFNVIIMASITTLVFNANPLMKFDGYYILSDALAIPNLYAGGQQYLRYWARRFLLLVPATLPMWPRGKSVIIRVYGVAAFVWRLIVCASLIIAASALFHGAGVVLACLAAVLWLGLPTLRFLKYFILGKSGEQPHRLHFLFWTSAAAAACVAVFGFVPWPGTLVAPAIVEYSPNTQVRADSAGFIREIKIVSGQHVDRGQLLVVLENRELLRRMADMQLAIRQSEIRDRQHEQNGELARQQGEAKNREALQTQLHEARTQVAHLSVRSPCSGMIVRRNLEALLGTYLERGDEIISVVDEERKELRISISQDDIDDFNRRIGRPVRIDLPGRAFWNGELTRVIPRASLAPTHPALAAANGGPLPVKPIANRNINAPDVHHELFSPRFTGIVLLGRTTSRQLGAGQRGMVSHRPCDESIGEHFYHALSFWIRERFHQ